MLSTMLFSLVYRSAKAYTLQFSLLIKVRALVWVLNHVSGLSSGLGVFG